MKRPFIILLLLIPFMVGLISCGENIVFEKNLKTNVNGWSVNDTLVFRYELKDTTALHDIYLNIRNTTDYSNSNFFVFFQTTFPDGRVFRDTVEMTLADKQGQWTGKGFGKIKANSFHFRKDVWFPVLGEYEFTIQHAMREESVKGISDMGLRIEKK